MYTYTITTLLVSFNKHESFPCYATIQSKIQKYNPYDVRTFYRIISNDFTTIV